MVFELAYGMVVSSYSNEHISSLVAHSVFRLEKMPYVRDQAPPFSASF